MRYIVKIVLSFIALSFMSGCAYFNQTGMKELKQADAFHQLACSSRSTDASPWHIRNLYDCETRHLYIPYHLWTGVSWNGEKNGDCMHAANQFFRVNGHSETTIQGPQNWTHPLTGDTEVVWVRKKVNGSKTQYFTCHEKGIGRVFDSRRTRHYLSGRCKFPAGYGWELFKRRSCRNTAIEIINIGLDDNDHLSELKFKWWYGYTLDHIYRYAPNVGMTHAWQQ